MDLIIYVIDPDDPRGRQHRFRVEDLPVEPPADDPAILKAASHWARVRGWVLDTWEIVQ